MIKINLASPRPKRRWQKTQQLALVVLGTWGLVSFFLGWAAHRFATVLWGHAP